jgi:hypothetical protein
LFSLCLAEKKGTHLGRMIRFLPAARAVQTDKMAQAPQRSRGKKRSADNSSGSSSGSSRSADAPPAPAAAAAAAASAPPVRRTARMSVPTSTAAVPATAAAAARNQHANENVREKAQRIFDALNDAERDWAAELRIYPFEFEELSRFLILKAMDGDVRTDTPGIHSPSPELDSIWHVALLRPAAYRDLCETITGACGGERTIIDHDPSRVDDDMSVKAARYTTTLLRYQALFGQLIAQQLFVVHETLIVDQYAAHHLNLLLHTQHSVGRRHLQRARTAIGKILHEHAERPVRHRQRCRSDDGYRRWLLAARGG